MPDKKLIKAPIRSAMWDRFEKLTRPWALWFVNVVDSSDELYSLGHMVSEALTHSSGNTFTASNTIAATLFVAVEGVVGIPTTHYTVSGATITFTSQGETDLNGGSSFAGTERVELVYAKEIT